MVSAPFSSLHGSPEFPGEVKEETRGKEIEKFPRFFLLLQHISLRLWDTYAEFSRPAILFAAHLL